jgi:tetratricopeptide (TPR) repeat protein
MDYLSPVFTSRAIEMEKLDACCNFAETNKSRTAIISGHSGTGKSFLIKQVLNQVATKHKDSLILYIDLSSDEFVTTMLFESLIYLCWNEKAFNSKSLLQIPDKAAFSSFLKTRKLKKSVITKFLAVVSSTVEMIPSYGKPLKEIIPQNIFEKEKEDPTPDIAVTFFKYLEFLSQRMPVYLSIDNYQFLQRNLRLLLESHIEAVEKNLCFITVVRTLESETDAYFPTCFSSMQLDLRLKSFTLHETIELFSKLSTYTSNSNIIAEDCYKKTNGNLKEIEYYISSLNHLAPSSNRNDIKTLVETLRSLPRLEKYLVTIASLFPAGIRLQYVTRLLSNILLVEDEERVSVIIGDLVKIGYLYLNGHSADLVKPAHEKIIHSIKKGLSEDEFIEMHRELLASMESLINGPIQINDYNYLLHCYVGVFTANQFKGKIEYVIRLFDIQYKSNRYFYILAIYKEFKEMINFLPEHSVEQILDACQKASEFYLGMEALKLIENQSGRLSSSCKLFYVKYLTQTYHFQKALELIKELDPSEKVFLYQLNILQHLCHDKEAKRIIKQLQKNKTHRHEYYIILRNSAHYFSYDDALINLITSYNYFRQNGLLFEEATGLNNLGVIHLWNGSYENARKCLSQAVEIFENLNSNELFEPLCNLGILSFQEGNYVDAKRHTEKSLSIVSRSLMLDHIILTNNILIFRLALKEISMNEYNSHLRMLYTQCKLLEDPWLHFSVIYNLSQSEIALSLQQTASPNPYFLDRINQRKETGTELITSLVVDGHGQLDLLLSLSPHWRY